MQSHQETVIREKEELDEKLNRLASFIQNDSAYYDLPEYERTLLVSQVDIMQSYSDILSVRINNFTN